LCILIATGACAYALTAWALNRRGIEEFIGLLGNSMRGNAPPSVER
jgi:hypothetical protein